MARRSSIALFILGMLCLAGCGGGAGSGSSSPVSPTVTSVRVSCTPVNIQTSQTSQCSATVAGTGNYSSAVTWSATNGTITAAGVFTPNAAATATLTATSAEDSTKSGSATVTVSSTGPQTSCNITAAGTILADGSLGGDPLLGDVYQIEGTITANYVDDDEVGNSTFIVTAPDGNHTVTSGLFLLNAHANGLNTYAARVAAGYESKGVWVPGTWTWQMNMQDRAGDTCTASGSYSVSPAFNSANGFLRQFLNTPNLVTDGNNQAFWPTGMGWYFPYWNGSAQIYNDAEIPAQAYVNVNGTSVTWVSGTTFSTQTLPAGVANNIYICPNLPVCTPYWNVAVENSTSITLPSSGGTYSNVPAYLGFTRDLHSGSRALGYQSSLAAAAQFYSQWGDNFSRYADSQFAEVVGTYLASGYNTYNYNTASGIAKWGTPAVDLWFAAAHAAGIHLMFGGPWAIIHQGPCPGFACTPTEKQNLENLYAMISNRYGAFYDVLELSNEQDNVPQSWVDSIGALLTAGVPGINGGNPADPYSHFFTNSYFPNNPNYYLTTYGPFSVGASDAYLNLVDLPHLDNLNGMKVYQYQLEEEMNRSGCPGVPGYGGATLPRYNGEEATNIGVTPNTQSASTPNDETNGPRIVDESNVLNQCGGGFFSPYSDQMAINTVAPVNTSSWYDVSAGRVLLQSFMKGLDPAAAPLTVTLGGGCAGNNCSYAALGSSSHVRLELNSSAGNGATGVPNAVIGGTITLSVPQPRMTGKWWNTANGSVIGTVTTSATAGTQTLAVPSFNVDIWFQLDP